MAPEESARWAILGPAGIFAATVGVCFILLMPTVAYGFIRGVTTGQVTLSAEHPQIIQTFIARHVTLNGVVLATTPDSNLGSNAMIRLCLRGQNSAEDLVCQTGRRTQAPAYPTAYLFYLPAPASLRVGAVYTLSATLINATPADRVTLRIHDAPARDREQYVAYASGQAHPGSVVGMVLLRPFEGNAALAQFHSRITEDGRFIPAWVLTLLVTQWIIWQAIRRAASGPRTM